MNISMKTLFGAFIMLLSCTTDVCAQSQVAATTCKQSAKAITVNLYYTGKNGSARKFVEEMEGCGIADSIRHEKGNLRYDYFLSLSDPETVLLIDSWSSQEAIDAHHASSMMKSLAGLREKYDLHMRVERYVNDTASMPATDDRYIRH